jgi:hypothetical protein
VFDRGFGFLVTASDISKNMYRQQRYLNPLLKCARSPTQHFIKRECTVLRTAINAIFAGIGKRDTWRGVAVITQDVWVIGTYREEEKRTRRQDIYTLLGAWVALTQHGKVKLDISDCLRTFEFIWKTEGETHGVFRVSFWSNKSQWCIEKDNEHRRCFTHATARVSFDTAW